MSRLHSRVGALCLALVLAVPVTGAFAQDPRALEVLKLADAATKRVKACTYDAEFYGADGFEGRVPRIKGRFMMRDSRVGFFKKLFGKEPAPHPSFRARLTVLPEAGGAEKHLDISTDGKKITFINEDDKYYLVQESPLGEPLLGAAKQLYMIEFLHPTPFSDEINGRSQKYEGRQDISGVECDVVYVEYTQPTLKARWYFGAEDHLPRRVDRIFKMPQGAGTRVLALANLDTTPEISPAEFRPPCPVGFDERSMGQRAPNRLLQPGTPAPDWKLKTVDGKPVQLADYRGKLVVIEFWATWCDYCKKTMPELEALHKAYEGKPVEFVGISCWDNPDDLPARLKAMGCTFTIAQQGDAVASLYKVEGLPTYYLIDRKGLIVESGAGVSHTAPLRSAIDKLLANSAK